MNSSRTLRVVYYNKYNESEEGYMEKGCRCGERLTTLSGRMSKSHKHQVERGKGIPKERELNRRVGGVSECR